MARAVEADVVRFDRETFLTQVWDYGPGDHVTVLAPTTGGKTHLSYQLLGQSATPECPAVVMVMKPRDKATEQWTKRLDFETVRDWPPPVTKGLFRDKKVRGWTVWPRHVYDPELDDPRHRALFRKVILDSYKKGNRILFADETYSLEEELGLSTELRTVWTKGAAMGCGMWAASQRPAYISKWAYQAHHLFLGGEPDEDTQRRLSEIGAAVDAGKVRWLLPRLGKWEFLYINRDEKAMCIVGA
jgi:hypothetical protein